MQINSSETEVILYLQLNDDNETADPIEDVTYDDANLVMRKVQPGDAGMQTVTLVEGVLDSYEAASWIQVTGNLYQFCVPASWIIEGHRVVVEVQYGSARPQRDVLEIVSGGTSSTPSVSDDVSEVFDSENNTISWIRGDDYLVANCGHFDIEVDESCFTITEGSSTAYFRASNDSKTSFVEGNAALVREGGVLKIRITANRTQTAAAEAGVYNWDAEIEDHSGYVRTRKSGKLELSESWTDIIT